MAVLLKTASVRVSFIQIMQVRVQNKGKSVWKSRYVGDVSSITDDGPLGDCHVDNPHEGSVVTQSHPRHLGGCSCHVSPRWSCSVASV